jgi:hypothetical protein
MCLAVPNIESVSSENISCSSRAAVAATISWCVENVCIIVYVCTYVRMYLFMYVCMHVCVCTAIMYLRVTLPLSRNFAAAIRKDFMCISNAPEVTGDQELLI